MPKNNDNFCCTCHIFNGILFLAIIPQFKQCFNTVLKTILKNGGAMDYEVVTTVVGIIITAAVSVVGYFLKRTMNRQDDFATKEDIVRIEKEVGEHKQDIKTLNDKYATKAELREIKEDIADMRASIEYLRENAIGREDFFRNISEVKEDIKDLKDFLIKK